VVVHIYNQFGYLCILVRMESLKIIQELYTNELNPRGRSTKKLKPNVSSPTPTPTQPGANNLTQPFRDLQNPT
jgi:hypothetical protein